MRWWLIGVVALVGTTLMFENVATSGPATTRPGVSQTAR